MMKVYALARSTDRTNRYKFWTMPDDSDSIRRTGTAQDPAMVGAHRDRRTAAPATPRAAVAFYRCACRTSSAHSAVSARIFRLSVVTRSTDAVAVGISP